MKISVLVCTRNRAQSLSRTLQSLLAPEPRAAYEREIVVVDNGSTDETGQLVERLRSAQRPPLRYVYEPKRGLSYARNTGIRNSDGEVVAFTDDDVLVSENWLDEIHREFAADPGLRALGGRVLLARAELQPIAFLDCAERRVFRYPHAGDFAMGANMAFRRSLFAEVGLFDVRLGAGRYLAGGEDIEMFYRALKAGHQALYAPDALVYHDHDRLLPEQVCRLEYSYGKGFSGYLLKHILRGDGYAARVYYWSALGLPERWRRQTGEADEQLRRRRAHVRGMLAGLLAAPLLLWGDGETRSGRVETGDGERRRVGEKMA
jgi:glycosyltransferase involved in cell wall biosynthesis